MFRSIFKAFVDALSIIVERNNIPCPRALSAAAAHTSISTHTREAASHFNTRLLVTPQQLRTDSRSACSKQSTTSWPFGNDTLVVILRIWIIKKCKCYTWILLNFQCNHMVIAICFS